MRSAPRNRTSPSALPGGLVAAATHTGPVDRIGGTHQAVVEWSRRAGRGLAGPRWEIYGDPDPTTDQANVEVIGALAAP